jgi:mannonate dehydratase
MGIFYDWEALKLKVGIHSSEKNVSRLIQYCHQLGISNVCLACSAIEGYDERNFPDPEALKSFKSELERSGIKVPTMIISKWPSQEVLLRKPGSEKELEALCLTLESLGKAGIGSVLIYPEVDKPVGRLKEEECWRKLRQCYEELVDCAERAKVGLANHAFYHPWKIVRDAGTLMRLLKEVPSPYNGVTYCQGLFQMGDDPYEAITLFGEKIFFAHARDLKKLRYPHRFEEVFLGEGDVDIPKTLRLLEAIGYKGIICPEHLGSPRFEGENLEAKAVEYLKRFVPE